ncbi:MAG: hypothetical protein ACXVPD_10845, partial [Bacteroidia bacterium]
WLPILVFEKRFAWTKEQTYRITIIAALLHALSTVLLGIVIGLLSYELSTVMKTVSAILLPSLLILLGIVFMVRHHKHNHFHLVNEEQMKTMDARKIISVLLVSMFLSPCLEIEGYFIMAGSLGWKYILLVSLLYILISVIGILAWMSFAKSILNRINAHKIEHNAGLISGIILIVTGLLNFVMH